MKNFVEQEEKGSTFQYMKACAALATTTAGLALVAQGASWVQYFTSWLFTQERVGDDSALDSRTDSADALAVKLRQPQDASFEQASDDAARLKWDAPALSRLTRFREKPIRTASLAEGKTRRKRSIQEQAYCNLVTIGNEFRVNSYIAGTQQLIRMAAFPNGDIISVWMSDGQDGDGQGIFGQRLDPFFQPIGSEFRINDDTADDQSHPSVATFSDGGFVVVWRALGQFEGEDGVAFRLYDSAGTPAGESMLAALIRSDGPIVVTQSNDHFIVQTLSNTDGSVYVKRFNRQGVELDVGLKANLYQPASASSIAVLDNDDIITVWANDNEEGIYAQRFTSNGERLNSEFKISSFEPGGQEQPSIASLKGGGFVVVWSIAHQDGDSNGIFGQRYDASGAVGPEFPVNRYTGGSQVIPKVIGLKDGTFLVTWSGEGEADVSGVYAKHYRPDGGVLRDDFLVNSYTPNYQGRSELALLSKGGLIIGWSSVNDQAGSGYDVYAQPYGCFYLLHNALVLNQGEQLTFNNQNLQADFSGIPFNQTELLFQISNVTQGWFAHKDTPMSPLQNFTQSMVSTDQLVFVHDASDQAPKYQLSVTLPDLSEFNIQPFFIHGEVVFTRWLDTLQLVNNTLRLMQNDHITMSQSNLAAIIDVYDPEDIVFLVHNLTAGQFELRDREGFAVTNFTQRKVSQNQVIFIHDGSEAKPHYLISASYQENTLSPLPANIVFTAWIDTLALNHAQLVLNQGEVVLMEENDLSASIQGYDENDIIFRIVDVRQGQFEQVGQAGVPISQFSQRWLREGKVRFVHDGSPIAPSYTVQVSYGERALEPVSAQIGFHVNTITSTTHFFSSEVPIAQTAITLSTTDVMSEDKSGSDNEVSEPDTNEVFPLIWVIMASLLGAGILGGGALTTYFFLNKKNDNDRKSKELDELKEVEVDISPFNSNQL